MKETSFPGCAVKQPATGKQECNVSQETPICKRTVYVRASGQRLGLQSLQEVGQTLGWLGLGLHRLLLSQVHGFGWWTQSGDIQPPICQASLVTKCSQWQDLRLWPGVHMPAKPDAYCNALKITWSKSDKGRETTLLLRASWINVLLTTGLLKNIFIYLKCLTLQRPIIRSQDKYIGSICV